MFEIISTVVFLGMVITWIVIEPLCDRKSTANKTGGTRTAS